MKTPTPAEPLLITNSLTPNAGGRGSPVVGVAERRPGVGAADGRLGVDVGPAVREPVPVRGHPALPRSGAAGAVPRVTGHLRVDQEAVVVLPVPIVGEGKLGLMIGHLRVRGGPEKVGRGDIELDDARIFGGLGRGGGRQAEAWESRRRPGAAPTRFFSSGTTVTQELNP